MSTVADRHLKDAVRLPIPLTGPGYEEVLATVKRAFNLKDAVDIGVVDQAFSDSGTTVYLRFAREVQLRGKELGEADGIAIRSGGTLSLSFDKKGELSSYILDDNAEETILEGKHGLVGDLQKGTIYFAGPREKVDTLALTSMGKKFYVQVDADGKKRLHRVYL